MVKVLKKDASGRCGVEFFSPGAAGLRVMLAGSFNDWEPEQSVMEYDSGRGGYRSRITRGYGEP